MKPSWKKRDYLRGLLVVELLLREVGKTRREPPWKSGFRLQVLVGNTPEPTSLLVRQLCVFSRYLLIEDFRVCEILLFSSDSLLLLRYW